MMSNLKHQYSAQSRPVTHNSNHLRSKSFRTGPLKVRFEDSGYLNMNSASKRDQHFLVHSTISKPSKHSAVKVQRKSFYSVRKEIKKDLVQFKFETLRDDVKNLYLVARNVINEINNSKGLQIADDEDDLIPLRQSISKCDHSISNVDNVSCSVALDKSQKLDTTSPDKSIIRISAIDELLSEKKLNLENLLQNSFFETPNKMHV